MATVREGVMKKSTFSYSAGETNVIDVNSILSDTDLVVEIIERHIEEKKIDIKGHSIIVAGGFGVGSRENFKLVFDLAKVLGAEKWVLLEQQLMLALLIMQDKSDKQELLYVQNFSSLLVYLDNPTYCRYGSSCYDYLNQQRP